MKPRLSLFEDMADALLVAFRTGTPEAMQRHWSFTWHRRPWRGMRQYVLLDLGRPAPEGDTTSDISLDDAMLLVAKDYGFANWDSLKRYVESLPESGGEIAARPVHVYSASRDETTGFREWDAVIDRVRMHRLSGLLANGQMTDTAMERVSGLDSIKTLDLSGSKKLTDAGLKHLHRMPQLEHLNLSGTAITDEGLAVLQSLPMLKSIELAWTSIVDRGVDYLDRCERLEKVNLMGSDAGDGAIKALRNKPRLSYFFSGDGVTNAGLAMLREFPVFRSWQGGEHEMQLLGFDAKPNYLGLRGSFNDDGLRHVAQLDGLFALNMDASSLSVSSMGLAHLVDLPHLGWLAWNADDSSMSLIAAMPKLRMLMCQDTVATDSGFEALSRSPSIETIWGRRCYHLQTAGFRALSTMPRLRSLSVSCKNVGDDGLATLPDFPALRELMPMDVLDEGYRYIGRCIHLESLILMYCRETTDRATEHLMHLNHLRKYFVSYNGITDRTPQILSRITSLEELEFSGCAGLTNVGLAMLASLPALKYLKIDGMQNITSELLAAFPKQVTVRIES